jgi:hypothetical protein
VIATAKKPQVAAIKMTSIMSGASAPAVPKKRAINNRQKLALLASIKTALQNAATTPFRIEIHR